MEIWHLFNHIQTIWFENTLLVKTTVNKWMNGELFCAAVQHPPPPGGSVGILTSFSFHSVSLGVSKVNTTALFSLKISITPHRSLQPGTHTERLLKWLEAEQEYWMMCSFILTKSVRVTSYISDCRTSWERWNLAEPVMMIWDFIWHFTSIRAAFVFSSVSIQTKLNPHWKEVKYANHGARCYASLFSFFIGFPLIGISSFMIRRVHTRLRWRTIWNLINLLQEDFFRLSKEWPPGFLFWLPRPGPTHVLGARLMNASQLTWGTNAICDKMVEMVAEKP